MKFLAAIAVYLLTGAVLAGGILQAVKGNLWFLVIGFLVFVVALGKIGCLPKSH